MPKLIENLKNRSFRHLGGGKRALNTIYVGNLVDAIFLAIDKPGAVGQVFNLTDGELVSKKRFIDAIVQALHLPKPRPLSVPLWLARLIARGMEKRARRRGDQTAPRLTQARLKFLGLNLDFSIDKAKRELGYLPRVDFDQGMKQTMAWYAQNA